MTTRRRRRSGTRRVVGGAAAATLVLAATAAPAFGHATFEQKELPPDSDRGLVMSVPVEQKDAHNTKVTVRLPEGFDAFSCRVKASWSCAAEPAGSQGLARVTFTRVSDDKVGQVDLFNFSVHTPKDEGTYPIAVDQEYSNGQTVSWEGPENSFNPAPLLRIVTGK